MVASERGVGEWKSAKFCFFDFFRIRTPALRTVRFSLMEYDTVAAVTPLPAATGRRMDSYILM